MENGKISEKQLVFLMVWTIVATGILYLPITIGMHVTKDAWMIPLTFTASIFIALLATSIGSKYPDKTIIQYAPTIMGKLAGKVIGLVLILWFIIVCSIALREFGDFMDISLPRTHMIIPMGILVLLACYAVRSGLEVIGRVSEILFPFVFISIFIVVMLVTGEMKLERLLPVLEEGILPVLRGSMTPISFGGEIITILMLIPFLNRPGAARKSSVFAILIVASIGMQIETITTAVFGDVRSRLLFPYFHLIRMIDIGDLLQRLDIVFVVVIILGIFVKITVLLYCSVLSAAQWANMHTYRPIVFPMGVIISAFSLVFFDNIIELIYFLDNIFPAFALSTELGIPTILLIFNYIRERKRQSS